MSFNVKEKHLQAAEKIVGEIGSGRQPAPVDFKAFWQDNEWAVDDPWAKDCPQLPLGIARMSSECVFDELGIPEDWHRLTHDEQYRYDLNRKYNDFSEQIVGRRLLNEQPEQASRKQPEVKSLHDLFEAKNEWHTWSYWLRQSADNPDELAALLDRVENRLEELPDFLFPANLAQEKTRLADEGLSLQSYRGQRGPITFAMSVYGVENEQARSR